MCPAVRWRTKFGMRPVMQRQRKIALRDSLLSRYSDSLGELMMRSRNEAAFLATVSHELRTPLNSIIGFSDVILAMKGGGPEQAKAAEYASHISKSGRRLLDVVSDILDISKIESGTFVLNSQPTA